MWYLLRAGGFLPASPAPGGAMDDGTPLQHPPAWPGLHVPAVDAVRGEAAAGQQVQDCEELHEFPQGKWVTDSLLFC